MRSLTRFQTEIDYKNIIWIEEIKMLLAISKIDISFNE
jgi:hypothetical protein